MPEVNDNLSSAIRDGKVASAVVSLKTGDVLLAAPGVTDAPLQDLRNAPPLDTQVLTTTAPTGEKALVMFASLSALRQRNKQLTPLLVTGQQAVAVLQARGLPAAVLQTDGKWIVVQALAFG